MTAAGTRATILALSLMLACTPDDPPPLQPAALAVVTPSWVAVGEPSLISWNEFECPIFWSVLYAPVGSHPQLAGEEQQARVVPDLPGDYEVEARDCRHRVRVTVHAFVPRFRFEDAVSTLPGSESPQASDGRYVLFGNGTVLDASSGEEIGFAEDVGWAPATALGGGRLAVATSSCAKCDACCGAGTCGDLRVCMNCCATERFGAVHLYSLAGKVSLASTPVQSDAVALAVDEKRLAAAGADGALALFDVSDAARPAKLGCVRVTNDPVKNLALDGGRVVAVGTTTVRAWDESQFRDDCPEAVPAFSAPRTAGVSPSPSLVARNGLVIVGDSGPLEVFDLADPARVTTLDDLPAGSVALVGEVAAVSSEHETYLIDLAARSQPRVAGRVPLDGSVIAIGDALAVVMPVFSHRRAQTEVHRLSVTRL